MVVYLIFFLSGAAALVLEISWSRQIGLLFGHSVYAASIVLTSYFAGLTLGNWLGGRWVSRLYPLVGYAMAEFIVAGWALLVPFLLNASESAAIAPWLTSSSTTQQVLIRAVFSFLLLLPATTAMGATLPFVAQFFSRHHNSRLLRKGISKSTIAYALNTVGAFVGTVSSTFFLLITVGVTRSSYCAAVICLVCAALAMLVFRWEPCRSKSEDEHSTDVEPVGASGPFQNLVDLKLLFLSAASGFGTLMLQVLYTRMFSLVLHNSTYTFGIVVAVFLASLATGAGVAAKLRMRFDAHAVAGFAIGLGGLAVALSVILFVSLTRLEYFSYGQTFLEYVVGVSLLVTVVTAPAVVCLGMVLPLTWAMAKSGNSSGQIVGRLTSVNTLFAAAGAIAASFFFLPHVGLWQTFGLISIGYFLISFVLLWSARQRAASIGLGVALGVAIAFVLTSPTESVRSREMVGERLVQRWNSAYGWIDVVQRMSDEAFKVRQNLHYRFGATGRNAREFRQAHVPLLLSKDPHRVLFMGLGTGLTAGGAISFPDVEKITAVELIPEVVEAVRTLSEFNHGVIDHPKVEIVVDDARHFLLANSQEYDVIVSDLFVPWESETGYLYTVESYRAGLQRLKPDGLFCQWLPLYQLGTSEFELIANSFAKAFPYTTVWWGEIDADYPIVALIGTRQPIKLEGMQLDTRLQQLERRLGRMDQAIATPELVRSLYIGDWKFSAETLTNTDEYPRIEFLTPISNRNRELISGEGTKTFFDEVLSRLPDDSVQFHGRIQMDANQRHRQQRLILFGDQ